MSSREIKNLALWAGSEDPPSRLRASASEKAAEATHHSSGSDSNNTDTEYSSDSDVTSKRKSAEVRKSDRQSAASKRPIVISSSEDSQSVHESGSEVEEPSEGDASNDDAESEASEVQALQPRKRLLKARSQPARKSSKVVAKPAKAAASKKPKQRRKSSEAPPSADSSFEIDHGDGDPTRIEVLIAHFVRQSPTDPFPDFMPRAKTASDSESASAAVKPAHPKETVDENTIFYLIKYQQQSYLHCKWMSQEEVKNADGSRLFPKYEQNLASIDKQTATAFAEMESKYKVSSKRVAAQSASSLANLQKIQAELEFRQSLRILRRARRLRRSKLQKEAVAAAPAYPTKLESSTAIVKSAQWVDEFTSDTSSFESTDDDLNGDSDDMEQQVATALSLMEVYDSDSAPSRRRRELCDQQDKTFSDRMEAILKQIDLDESASERLQRAHRKQINQLLYLHDTALTPYQHHLSYFNPEMIQIDRIIRQSIEDTEYGHVVSDQSLITHYLVKWRALSYFQSSWESVQTLSSVPNGNQMIESFQLMLQTRSQKSMSPSQITALQQKRQAMSRAPYDGTEEFSGGRKLLPYQVSGINWLALNYQHHRNSLLADEMGLGKTVQAIMLMRHLYAELRVPGPFLIVAPLSTMQHWRREIEAFTDDLYAVIYHGSTEDRKLIRQTEFDVFDRKGNHVQGVTRFQVLITSFDTAQMDVSFLSKIPWLCLVVDEAHRMKSPKSILRTQLLRLRCEHVLLMTGTPIQNNMSELWSLLNFLDPNRFNSLDQFVARHATLETPEQVAALSADINQYILRRLKSDVNLKLMPKEEIIVEVELTHLQKRYYKAIFEQNLSLLKQFGKKGSQISLRNVSMQLRKCCYHPYLLDGVEDELLGEMKETKQQISDDDVQQQLIMTSGKMVLLDKLLAKLFQNGHKVLIFSQMTRVLDLIQDYCAHRRYQFERLDGQVLGNTRQEAIDRFSTSANSFIFLISTKAGGVGLTLTAADTVILFDCDWNPQNDLQAQARVNRIGQTKPVTIYRLVTRGTYESEMFERATAKLKLDVAVQKSARPQSSSEEKGDQQPVIGQSSVDAFVPSADEANENSAASREEMLEMMRSSAQQLFTDPDADRRVQEFQNKDIDEILAGSRVVRYEQNGESGPVGNALSSLSKAKFTPDGATEAIDMNDPDFWNKIGLKDQSKPTESVNELVLPENAVRSARQSRKQYYAGSSFSRPPCSRCSKNATVACRMCAKAFCTRHSQQHTEAHEVSSMPLFKAINQAQSSSSASELSESDAVISSSLGSSTESDSEDLHADEKLDDDAVKLGAKRVAQKRVRTSSTSPEIPATAAADPKQDLFGDQVVTPVFLRMGLRRNQDVVVLRRVFFEMLGAKIHSQHQYPDDPNKQVKFVRGFVRRQILTDASVCDLITSTPSTPHLLATFSDLIGQWDRFQSIMPTPAPVPSSQAHQQTSQTPVSAQPTQVPVQSVPIPAISIPQNSSIQELPQASFVSQPKQAPELKVQLTPISESQPVLILPPQKIAVEESKSPELVSSTPTASSFPPIPVASGSQALVAGDGKPLSALQRLDDALISAGFHLSSQIQDARSYFGFLAFHRLKCTEHKLNSEDPRSPTQLMKRILEKQIHHEARNGGGSIFNTARVLQTVPNARALYSSLEGLALLCYQEDPNSLQFPLASMPELPQLQQPLPPPPPPMDVSIAPFSANPGVSSKVSDQCKEPAIAHKRKKPASVPALSSNPDVSSMVSDQRKESAIVKQRKKPASVPVAGASTSTQSEISVIKSDQAAITLITPSSGNTRAELFDQLNEILSQYNILQHVEILDVLFYFRAVSVMWTMGMIVHRVDSTGQHAFLKLAIENCLSSSVSSDFCSGFVKQLIRAAANLAVVGSKISELCNKLQPLIRDIEIQKRPESSVQAVLRKHFNAFNVSDQIYVQLSSFLLMFVNVFWFRCLLARVNMRLLIQVMLAVAQHFQNSAETVGVDLILRTPTMIAAFKSAATEWLYETDECSQISLVKLSGRKQDLVAEVDAVWESFAQCFVTPFSQGESPPLKKSKHSTSLSTSDSTSDHSFSVARLSDDSVHQARRASTEMKSISLRDVRTTSTVLSDASPQASLTSSVDPMSAVAKTADLIESSENFTLLMQTEIQSSENVASMDVEPAPASSAPQTDSVVASVASIDQPLIDTPTSVPDESVPQIPDVVIQSSDALVSSTSLIRGDPIVIDDDDVSASEAFVSDTPFENSIVQTASNSAVTIERKVEFVWQLCQGKFDSEFTSPTDPTWAPGGIAVSSAGEVISVDNDSHTVFVHDLEGNLIRSWASPSVNVSALFVSAQNEIWMLDHRHHCIFVSHLDGSIARKKLSSRGEMPGELYYPHAIAVSPSGKEVYVADSGNHRVQVYRTETRKWGILHASGIVFNKPTGLALTSSGSIVISDSYNHRIVIVSSEGVLIRQWQTKGAKDKLIAPCSVVVSPSNEIFVCFQSDSRIQSYDLYGNLLRSWKTSIQPQYLAFAPNGLLYCSDGVAVVHVFR